MHLCTALRQDRGSLAPLAGRIDHREKSEAMEVRVERLDFFDPMFAHERRRVRIVQNVAA